MAEYVNPESFELRRSIYSLGNSQVVSDSYLIDTVKACLKNCPTAFNSQTARLAILFAEYHHDFWKLVWNNLKVITPDDKIESARKRIASFDKAYGTILFFEDIEELEKLKNTYPMFANNMHDWTMQSNGMLQYMIWQTLAENDEGMSLQHYNELIEGKFNRWLKLPDEWKIIAQMPWGSIEKEADEKTFLPLEPRVKIFN